MKYEFIRQGPHGEKPGTVVEGRDVKMNGLVTTSGAFIPWDYLQAVEEERVEVRDGREFKVTVLPEAEPPKKRSGKTRYHFGDVGKSGDLPTRKRGKK